MNSLAVRRRCAHCGRIGDEGIGSLAGEWRKSAPDFSRSREAPHPGRERVFTARVENDEFQPFHGFQLLQDVVEIDRLIFYIGIEFEFRVNRHEIIVAGDLDAMPGVEYRRNIRPDRPSRELAQFRAHVRHPEIGPDGHFVELGRREQVADRDRVARWVGQISDRFVCSVADHEGHAPFGLG